MQDLLALIVMLPLAGFAALMFGRRFPRGLVAAVGVGSVGASAAIATIVAWGTSGTFTQPLWRWLSVGAFRVDISLHLDPLSLAFVMVVTWVGFLIHLYSARFMAEGEGYARFFAWMNLFVASMLILVLADNLLLLYLGWEGVGLCSYLLIGFWYKEQANARAAVKAFIVTRVGDAALAVALLLIWTSLGTLDIAAVGAKASAQWASGSGLAIAAALLLLGGAVGKSAQLPLQTWLPDAMAGPTPVSALIHAATMVTAGVYLIARMRAIFELAPIVMTLVAVIGAATLLLAGFSALTQRDIKRVLAYSTMSQVGTMFLALGVGAWSASVYHFVTHAFFKSLLFLAAGVVILRMREEHDMFRMGGLRKKLPLTFWTFLIGALALSALPPTAGFFSKDAILAEVWKRGGAGLWLAGLVGALITSLYTFRMVFLVFFGEAKEEPKQDAGWTMGIPLVILATSSVVAGFFRLPEGGRTEWLLMSASAAASLAGILIAWLIYVRRPEAGFRFGRTKLAAFWLSGWGFDVAYDTLFVRPLAGFARVNRGDFIDAFFRALAALALLDHRAFSGSVTGRVRWYVAGLACGAVVVVAVLVLL